MVLEHYVGKEERVLGIYIRFIATPPQALFKIGTDHLNGDVGSLIITLLGKGR